MQNLIKQSLSATLVKVQNDINQYIAKNESFTLDQMQWINHIFAQYLNEIQKSDEDKNLHK